MNQKATKEAEAFMIREKLNYESLTQDQAYLVYKLILISEELMVKGLLGMHNQP